MKSAAQAPSTPQARALGRERMDDGDAEGSLGEDFAAPGADEVVMGKGARGTAHEVRPAELQMYSTEPTS